MASMVFCGGAGGSLLVWIEGGKFIPFGSHDYIAIIHHSQQLIR
jgi:hypothetical protein